MTRRIIRFLGIFVSCISVRAQQAIVPMGQEMSNAQGSVSVSIGQIHYITIPEVWSGVQQPLWNYYSIVTKSDIGTTTGDGKYRIGDTAIIAAKSTDVCYAFTKWSDNDTSNPRSLFVTQDSTLTAIFEKIQYNISVETNDPLMGDVDIIVNEGHEYVDLGLSVKWATCNVGASSSEEYGDYFAWGETTTKMEYNPSTYKYYDDNYKLTKYCLDSINGVVDNKMTLEKEDDAANVNWGGNWRMPTRGELLELYSNCNKKMTYNYNGTGITGYIFTSNIPGYTHTSIFLPAAGGRLGKGFTGVGKELKYWSSSNGQNNPWQSYAGGVDCFHLRIWGLSVRAVCP